MEIYGDAAVPLKNGRRYLSSPTCILRFSVLSNARHGAKNAATRQDCPHRQSTRGNRGRPEGTRATMQPGAGAAPIAWDFDRRRCKAQYAHTTCPGGTTEREEEHLERTQRDAYTAPPNATAVRPVGKCGVEAANTTRNPRKPVVTAAKSTAKAITRRSIDAGSIMNGTYSATAVSALRR